MNAGTGVITATANNVYSHGGHEVVNIAGGDVDPAALDLSNFVVTSANVAPGLVASHVASQNANWAAHNVTVNLQNNYAQNLDGSGNPVSTGLLQLNGHDRFAERDGTYFNSVQPYQHFPHAPSQGINVYSFAANPAEHQPSGSCNFSRIDNAQLVLTIGGGVTGTLNVYALNYNVLRVMSGMGGLAYSN